MDDTHGIRGNGGFMKRSLNPKLKCSAICTWAVTHMSGSVREVEEIVIASITTPKDVL